MDKRKIIIILSFILLIITINFVVTNRTVLFNGVVRNGGTFIELEVANEINAEDIKANINKNTNLNIKDINIENSDGKLEIRFKLMEPDVINSIENSLINEFGNNVKIISYTRIGKSNNSIGLYMIYIAIITSFLLSIFLISRNISLISHKNN